MGCVTRSLRRSNASPGCIYAVLDGVTPSSVVMHPTCQQDQGFFSPADYASTTPRQARLGRTGVSLDHRETPHCVSSQAGFQRKPFTLLATSSRIAAVTCW